MRRAVGYCEKDQCEDFCKGVFLLNYGDAFHCPRCRELGSVVPEKGSYTGKSNIFKEVRVEFNWDNVNREYQEIAIVRDESLWGRCNTYVLQSPLIKTEQRGLKVAEAILSNLNKFSTMTDLDNGDIPATQETLLSFDKPLNEFKQDLNVLADDLSKSPLARKESGRNE
jgi:phage FluMu protein Com